MLIGAVATSDQPSDLFGGKEEEIYAILLRPVWAHTQLVFTKAGLEILELHYSKRSGCRSWSYGRRIT